MRDNGVGVHGSCSNEFARWSVSHGGSEEIHDLGGSRGSYSAWKKLR